MLANTTIQSGLRFLSVKMNNLNYWTTFVLLLCQNAVRCAETTTTIYDIPVPGSHPIRIVEGEPLWRPHSRFEHRSFTTDVTKTNLNNPINEEENERDRSEALKEFLANYAENLRKSKPMQSQEEPDVEQQGEKSKSWNLLSIHKHKHPYEDNKGWVSLEPVPWSVSKISKWQPNRPNEKPYDVNKYENPYFNVKPTSASDKYDVYYVNKPEVVPQYPKPSAIYGQKVHLDYRKPANGFYKHEHDEDCKHNDNSDIITDGLPPNFPSAYQPETIKRRGAAETYPESHPFNGDGEWVLLSTTKGYKYPKPRQRSIDINEANSIGTHRGVRLTVLPPLKGSKVNMTTSHGGLLQVDGTFETVEQSRNKLLKKQKVKRQQQRPPTKRRKPKPQKNVAKPSKVISPTVATVPRRTPESDSSAVLAAVGAGMIPATMAMLMPMAMNGRRRRRDVFNYPQTQIIIPRRFF